MTNNYSATHYAAQLRAEIAAPSGFDVAIRTISFFVEEQGTQHSMNLALVHSHTQKTPYAATTTTNAITSPSVEYIQQQGGRGTVRTLLINNKISNVGSRTGHENFTRIQKQIGVLLGIKPQFALPISTGVIGWSLPIEDITNELDALRLQMGKNDFVDFAQAIMTTDRFPKVRSIACGDGVILGVCKGAGMVEPNLNTMLVFFFTDLSFSNRELAYALRHAVHNSFGSISIDGDQSTSDIVMIQSSCLRRRTKLNYFTACVSELAEQLALDVVRNGEGVGHLLRMCVNSARSDVEAKELARFLLNSRLIATAIAGNDPNIGRLVARLGQYFGNAKRGRGLDSQRVRIYVESQLVFEHGYCCLSPHMESLLNQKLVEKSWDSRISGYSVQKEAIDITIELRRGAGAAVVYGGDLTEDYVRINSDYRS